MDGWADHTLKGGASLALHLNLLASFSPSVGPMDHSKPLITFTFGGGRGGLSGRGELYSAGDKIEPWGCGIVVVPVLSVCQVSAWPFQGYF